jgi:hypothetical protein
LSADIFGRALASGFLTPEGLRARGVTAASIRQYVAGLRAVEPQRLFLPEEAGVYQANYAVVELSRLTWRLRLLQQFDCLDLVPREPIISRLREHQVLSGRMIAANPPLNDPASVEGLFVAAFDPLRDTYLALTCLSCFDALDRIDRGACIQGILRLHLGKGLFGLSEQNKGLLARGDAQSTFFAYESLRILNALGAVKNLRSWEFRPLTISIAKGGSAVERVVTGHEIEAWLYQERLDRYLRARGTNVSLTAPSLLAPGW